MPSAVPRVARSRAVLWAAVVALVLAVAWIATLPRSTTYGWDESMHVALPAAQMRIALAEGEVGRAFDALLGCAQYPFVQPVALAAVQGVLGGSERVARAFGIVQWAAALVGVFVLVRLLLASMPEERRPRGAAYAPWLAFALAALSPLGLGFAGTLFLEVTSACIGVWTLVAWLALWRRPSRARAVVVGALITAALFTKWNYGLLLGVGLLVDLALRCWPPDVRRERVRLVPALALVPVLALAWWFLLPVPGGTDVAAEHRAALFGFLEGNRDMQPVAFAKRLFYAAAMLAPPPRYCLLLVCGLVAAIAQWRLPSVRTLLLVLLAAWVPVWLHPFFLERFLLPGAVVLFTLAALGIARWSRSFVLPAVLVLAATVPLPPGAPVTFDTRLALEFLLPREAGPRGSPQREYAYEVIGRSQSLWTNRFEHSAGLEREEARLLLDLVAREARPDERIGWLGMSSELSPAVLLLGRLDRGGTRAAFLRDASAPMGWFEDPRADAATVRAFAQAFDVVFLTDPPDLKGRSAGAWAAATRTMLTATGEWTEREIGRVDIARPMQAPLRVTLFACRRRT